MLAITRLQDTELLVAGFPCIDVSRAGLRLGLEGQVRYGYVCNSSWQSPAAELS